MRLRLVILRNQLPQTEILWTVDEDAANHQSTIAQLLERVNDVIPLEAEDWGLEDYVVQVGDFECLHFSKLRDILKDEDEVIIRPLQTSEIRSRTLSGRCQISASGLHLIDGIPFGRPFLRRVDRPPVRIPPRKRRRLALEDTEEPLLGLPDAENSSESSELRIEAKENYKGIEKPTPTAQAHDDAIALNKQRPRRSKSVRFEQAQRDSKGRALMLLQAADDGDEESSDDEDFQPDSDDTASSEGEEDWESEDDSSDSLSESSTDTSSFVSSSEESVKEKGRTKKQIKSPQRKKADKGSNKKAANAERKGKDGVYPQQEDSVGGTTKKRANAERLEKDGVSLQAKSDRKQLSTPEPAKQPSLTQPSPPYAGQVTTKARNRRRRDSKKLKSLKRAGIFPTTATREDLENWRSAQASERSVGSGVNDAEGSRESQTLIPEVKSKVPLEQVTDDAVVSTIASQRQELLDAIASGGIEVKSHLKRDRQALEETKKAVSKSSLGENGATLPLRPEADDSVSLETAVEPPQKRARLDIASSRRMVFGSLGLRNPKTQADAEMIKEKLMAPVKARNLNRASVQKADVAKGVGTAMDNDHTIEDHVESTKGWEGKVELTAVECFEPHGQLSAPPFPFMQRWHSNQTNQDMQHLLGKKGTHRNKKRNGKLSHQNDQDWSYEETNFTDQNINQAHEEEEDLPPLPADMKTLPDLTEVSLKPGAIVAFKRLEVSKDTNWTPVVSGYRKATVSKPAEGGSFQMILAKRDRPRKDNQYDEDGNRIYAKFEMVGFDDANAEDSSSEGVISASFQELLEPKLLQPAPETPDSFEPQQTVRDTVEGVREAMTEQQVDSVAVVDNTTLGTLDSVEFEGFGTPTGGENIAAAVISGISDTGIVASA